MSAFHDWSRSHDLMRLFRARADAADGGIIVGEESFHCGVILAWKFFLISWSLCSSASERGAMRFCATRTRSSARVKMLHSEAPAEISATRVARPFAATPGVCFCCFCSFSGAEWKSSVRSVRIIGKKLSVIRPETLFRTHPGHFSDASRTLLYEAYGRFGRIFSSWCCENL
jgi:hypothetical protein